MPTPKGKGLAGSADDRTPGWEARTNERVRQSEADRMRKNKAKRDVQARLEWDLEMQILLRLAAEKRGMPTTAYARRAIAAFVASDLDLPFEEVCGLFAAPFKPGEMLRADVPNSRRETRGKTRDDGKGYGSWAVS